MGGGGSGGGKGGSSRKGGGKGGGGKGGGSKGGGRAGRSRGGSGAALGNDAGENVYYSASMVENPWRDLLPDEPPTFPFASMSNTAAGSRGPQPDLPQGSQAMAPPADSLPSPSAHLLVDPDSVLSGYTSAVAELTSLLAGVNDPGCCHKLCPIVQQTIKRVKAVVGAHHNLCEETQPMKRSRLTLPPPQFALGEEEKIEDSSVGD